MINTLHSVYVNSKTIQYLDKYNILCSYPNYLKNQRIPNKLSFYENIKIEPYCAFLGGRTLHTMGSFSYTHSSLPEDTIVGRYCSISSSVETMGLNHPLNRISTSSFTYDHSFEIFNKAFNDYKVSFEPKNFQLQDKGPIIIEHDVWIGEGAVLAKGITIGIGSVIGAKAVVTKDVPPYAVVVGNPARVVKYRFDDQTIIRLLNSRWWNFDFTIFDSVDIEDNIYDLLDALEAKNVKSPIPLYIPNVLKGTELYNSSKEQIFTKNSCFFNNIKNKLRTIRGVKQ